MATSRSAIDRSIIPAMPLIADQPRSASALFVFVGYALSCGRSGRRCPTVTVDPKRPLDPSLGTGLKQREASFDRSPPCLVTVSANDISNLPRDRRSPAATPARLPGPEQSEAFAMPADDCFRLDDHQGTAPIRPKAGDQDPEPTIGWMQSWSGRLPVQHGQLLAHRQALEIRGSQCPIKPMQNGYEEQGEHLSHGREAIWPSPG